jgi:hypothetical protein
VKKKLRLAAAVRRFLSRFVPSATAPARRNLEERDVWLYLRELDHVVDAALHRFRELEGAADRWLDIDMLMDPKLHSPGSPGQACLLGRSTRQQSSIFDAIEAFLAAYVRASVLLSPTTTGDSDEARWRRRRGKTLRERLGLGKNALAQRDVRDDWSHFDERLDTAIQREQRLSQQLFARASQVDGYTREHVLRLVEVDRLALSYRDRDGALKLTELHRLRDELGAVDAKLKYVLNGGTI